MLWLVLLTLNSTFYSVGTGEHWMANQPRCKSPDTGFIYFPGADLTSKEILIDTQDWALPQGSNILRAALEISADASRNDAIYWSNVTIDRSRIAMSSTPTLTTAMRNYTIDLNITTLPQWVGFRMHSIMSGGAAVECVRLRVLISDPVATTGGNTWLPPPLIMTGPNEPAMESTTESSAWGLILIILLVICGMALPIAGIILLYKKRVFHAKEIPIHVIDNYATMGKIINGMQHAHVFMPAVGNDPIDVLLGHTSGDISWRAALAIDFKYTAPFLGLCGDMAAYSVNINRVTSLFSVAASAVDPRRIYRWCHQIAHAVNEMHTSKIVHGNLVPDSIIINSNTSEAIVLNYLDAQRIDKHVWCAPGPVDYGSDSWDMAWLCWSMFHMMETPPMHAEQRPDKPADMSDRMYEVLVACWDPQSSMRPSIGSLSLEFARELEHIETASVDFNEVELE